MDNNNGKRKKNWNGGEQWEEYLEGSFKDDSVEKPK